MFLEDLGKKEAHRRFHPTRFGGFDVLDLGVLPQALQQVNAYITRHLYKERTLLLVEFARRSYTYQEVWSYFRSDVLSRAFFLYLEADIETCMKRVNKRARNQAFSDDQFVSPKIMFDYYGSAAGEPTGLQHYFGNRHVATIENTGTWQETWSRIDQFLSDMSAGLHSPGSSLPPSC
jgi:thymidylate kinase